MLIILPLLMTAYGVMLFFNIAGARDSVIRRVTSRSLGSLAPGYAATREGSRVFAILVIAIGVAFGGADAIVMWPQVLNFGAAALVLGVAAFLVASVFVIVGEIRTYRDLKR